MHHLHPRSRTTSTLFTTTLAVSFLVVTLPHLLPCPVDRRQFADTIEGPDGKPRRRRRVKEAADDATPSNGNEEALNYAKRKRECPVPKPGGFVGQMMGFEKEEGRKGPLEVVVKGMDGRPLRREGQRGSEDDTTP